MKTSRILSTIVLGAVLALPTAVFAAGNGNGNANGHDDDRGRGQAEERLADRGNEGRGNGKQDADNHGKSKITEPGAPVVVVEKGPDGAAADGTFRNHGEKVSLFVKIAHALGFGGNTGAQQANFGTQPGDVNLDVNKDGAINDADRLAALNPPPAVTPVPVTPVPVTPPQTTPTTPAH